MCAAYIAITSELQPVLQQGWFFIWDNRTHQALTVTVENLTKQDESTFCCGMQKGFFPVHESADVEVIITPRRSLHDFPIATVTPPRWGAGALLWEEASP